MRENHPVKSTSALRHIPNAITSVRIIVAAIFPFCPEQMHIGLIGLGLATEFLDGFTARLFNWSSYLGQILDPVAEPSPISPICICSGQKGKIAATMIRTDVIALGICRSALVDFTG
jgi:phosphatidylglycerophosphate synthase